MAEQEVVKDSQTDPLPKLEEIFFLRVQVNSASDLDASDFMSGKSDPFCKVIANKQSWCTKHILKELNPKWNEETSFVFFTAVPEITFEVFDWDGNSKHDKIGVATLPVAEYYNKGSKGFTGNIPLKECKKGALNITVSGRTVKPLELEERICNLEKECNEQEDELKRKNEECDKLAGQQDELARKKVEYENNQKSLTQQRDSLKSQVREQRSRNAEKQQQIDECNKRIAGKRIKCDDKKKEIDEKTKECEQLKNEYQQEKAKKDKYIEEREELNDKNNKGYNGN